MELPELITLYTGAWSEPDRALRQQLLERAWAEDGTYTDPTAHDGKLHRIVGFFGPLVPKP